MVSGLRAAGQLGRSNLREAASPPPDTSAKTLINSAVGKAQLLQLARFLPAHTMTWRIHPLPTLSPDSPAEPLPWHKCLAEPRGHYVAVPWAPRAGEGENAPAWPFHSRHRTAAGPQQNPALTLLTSRKPYTWQPSFFCSCIFWLNPSLLHCSMLSGFLKAQPRRRYASLTSSQVLQHLQKHKHHLTILTATKRRSSSRLVQATQLYSLQCSGDMRMCKVYRMSSDSAP